MDIQIAPNAFVNAETRTIRYTAKTCWSCKGTGKVNTYPQCPYSHRTVRKYGGKCPQCGAKNQHSHGGLLDKKGEQIVRVETCYICHGHGEYVPDAYDSQEIYWANLFQVFPVTVQKTGRGANFNESYIGYGVFGGSLSGADLGRYDTFEKIFAYLTKEQGYNFHQLCELVDRQNGGKLAEGFVLVIRSDGFALYPYWKK